jgi:antitoxin component of RelBE/YafQ-DinJ toxin-antitoxin module
MSVGEDEKQISVRVDAELVDEVDHAILKAKANQDLPMDFTRSDAVRDFLERVADDPAILYEDREDDENGQEVVA